MPKTKECTKLIPRIYRRNAENMMMFSWVNGQRKVVPAITIEQAIWSYFKFAGIDDWDMESARVTYQQMQNEFLREDCNEITKADR
jgi:hypothetical protein